MRSDPTKTTHCARYERVSRSAEKGVKYKVLKQMLVEYVDEMFCVRGERSMRMMSSETRIQAWRRTVGYAR